MQPTLKTCNDLPVRAERVIGRISELRELSRHLARIGDTAGAHRMVCMSCGRSATRLRRGHRGRHSQPA